MRTELSTTLEDAWGETHSYHLIQHPAGTGRPLLLKVNRAMLAAFGYGLEGVLGGRGKGLLDAEITGSSLESALMPASDLLLGDDGFMLSLFQHTQRDSKKLTKVEIDSAYQGNYGEMLEAMIWVIKGNFLDPLSRSLKRVLGDTQLVEVLARIKELKEQPTESSPSQE